MGTCNFLILVLFHSITIFLLPTSSLPIPSSVVYSLKTQQVSPGSNPTRTTSKLPFHHNASLTVTLSVGTPPQPVSMVLDTGSELSWLHYKKTSSVNSVFDPARSKSYSPLPCTSPVCKTRTRDLIIPATCDPSTKLCHATVSYADSSFMEGNLALETFHLGSSPIPGTAFGCMDSGFDSSSQADSKTTGLLGLNRGSMSFVRQLGYPKFSYCISGQDSSGVLLLGEVSLPWLKPLSYTPLVEVALPVEFSRSQTKRKR